MKVSWVKYKEMGGPRYRGEHVYDPPDPWGPWTRIMGVVARCEGKHDTTVMYDGTGVTWGFLQWTFTSGRLQRLLESFKAIPWYDFDFEMEASNVFDNLCLDDPSTSQVFAKYGFTIENGKFVSYDGHVLNPANPAQKKRINAICMGIEQYPTSKNQQKLHAMNLCQEFVNIGQDWGIHAAQIQFAKQEFKRAVEINRKPLGEVGTIGKLLDNTWETPVPAIFFNLWQNHPGGAYRFFLNSRKEASRKGIKIGSEGYTTIVWERLNRTAFADWGFKSKQYIQSAGKNPPRIKRIKPAIKEFYGIDLPYTKRLLLP